MILLMAGLAVFFTAHVFVGFRNQRAALIARLGPGAYRALFSLVSLAGLVMIVMGKAQAPFESLWIPPSEFSVIAKLLMLPALILVVASNVPCGICQRVKHPLLLGVKIWALVHLMVNGDLASVLLFGSFLLYAVVTMVRCNRRAEPESDAVSYPLWRDVVVLLVGGAAYALIGLYHAQLFGVAIH